MKRTHTNEPRRYGHHERASIAVIAARVLRRATRAVQLKFLAVQERCADAEFAESAALHELMIARMVFAQRRRVQLAAKRQLLERSAA